RAPDGGYTERHEPLSDDEAFRLTEHRPYRPAEIGPEEDEFGVRTQNDSRGERLRVRASSFYFRDQPEKLTSEQIAEAKQHILEQQGDGHAELESGDDSNGDGHADSNGAPQDAEQRSDEAATRS